MRESISMAGTRVLLAQRRMGGAVCVVVVVLMSTAVLGMNADGDGSKITCNETTAQTGISVSVDQKTKKVSFVCDTGMKTVLPSEGSSVTKCYTEKGLKEEEELVNLFGQGSQATVVASTGKSKQNSEVTLTLGELPQTMQTIYFVCTDSTASDAESPEGTGDPDASLTVPQAGAEAGGSVSPAPKPGAISGVNSVTPGVGARRVAVVDASHDAFRRSANRAAVGVSKQGESKARCVVTVTVPADPTASTCTVEKQNMDLEITNENKSVSFQCDTNISTLNPKESTTTIFDESCEKTMTLAEKLPSAKLEREGSRYTFSVGELPETAITLCYKCSSPADDTEESPPEQKIVACTVKINVAAADLDSDSAAFATTGSVPALVLGLGISLFFARGTF